MNHRVGDQGRRQQSQRDKPARCAAPARGVGRVPAQTQIDQGEHQQKSVQRVDRLAPADGQRATHGKGQPGQHQGDQQL
ncbi:hypothetical protein [Deinococcus sp.]|uniref:hypothetical protein n=1 Tax=Deinococcus sp. TaxID=47478 RepID=UPI0025C4498A|nr:hypothetical protein [Deinococcus sp.]